MPRLLNLIDKSSFNELTRNDKKKVKDLFYVKTDDELIEVAKLYGLEIGSKKRNQLIRTYKHFIKFYNKEAKKTNKEILTARKAKKNQQAKARREAKKQELIEAKQQTILNNVFEVKPVTATKLKQTLTKNFKNQIVIINYIYLDKLDGKKKIRGKSFDLRVKRWWDDVSLYFIVDSLSFIWDMEETSGGELIIYSDKLDNKAKKFINKQYFKDGITNCLLTPIKHFAEDKIDNALSQRTIKRYEKMVKDIEILESQYTEGGVPENEIYKISDKLQVDIIIQTPFQDEKFIEAKSVKHPLTTFKYLNSRFGHVDHITNKGNVENINNLENLVKQLDETKEFYTYTKGLNGYSSVSTLNGTYRVNDEDFNIISEFELEHNIDEIKLDFKKHYEVSSFICDGVHYNETIDFKDEKFIKKVRNGIIKPKHIDMIKAYAKCKDCPLFQGYLGKITDFRKTNKLMGNCLYKITNIKINDDKFKKLNDIMNIYVDNYIYTCSKDFF